MITHPVIIEIPVSQIWFFILLGLLTLGCFAYEVHGLYSDVLRKRPVLLGAYRFLLVALAFYYVFSFSYASFDPGIWFYHFFGFVSDFCFSCILLSGPPLIFRRAERAGRSDFISKKKRILIWLSGVGYWIFFMTGRHDLFSLFL